MNQMEIFKNPEFGSIRVIEENGKYLFCGTDVADALGYSNPRDALRRHCKGVVKRDTLTDGGLQQISFLPEGDLYRLIVHSKLPSAERFERWVFDEVLPTIRKHGAYLTKEKLWEVATSPEALMKLCSDLLAEREANISLRKKNAQLEGKAAFYDLFIDLKHSTNLRTTAKELDVPERRFVRFLIERRFVYRTASGKDNADTIIGNMDTSIFLGGKEPTTLKELAAVLGKETIDTYNTGESRGRETSHSLNYQKLGKELMSQDELAVMDGGKCILQLRGVRPFLSDKYDITKHPNFKYTADADDKNAFDIEAFLSARLKLKPNEVCDVYEVDTKGA